MPTLDPTSLRASRRAALGRFALALCALACGACVELQRVPGVMFATTPPGARIVVDGLDSGFVTPCHIDLTRERHEVDMVLEGYKPVSVSIESGGQTTLVFWDEAWVYPNTWRFPLWLNARDGFLPVKIERSYSPARVWAPLKLGDLRDTPRRGRGARKP